MTLPGEAEVGTLREALTGGVFLRTPNDDKPRTAEALAALDSLAALLQETREALAAYRSALRSGEPESEQLRALSDAALSPAGGQRWVILCGSLRRRPRRASGGGNEAATPSTSLDEIRGLATEFTRNEVAIAETALVEYEALLARIREQA